MEELLKTFTMPDNTKMEERSIVVDGGAIIGDHSDMGFGIIADSVIAGERVKIGGNVITKDEVRIDMWSHVSGDVRTKKDAYIGEFVNIAGKLIVGGDLDIGKDVNIKGGFEAKGWIVIRNPIPVIIYIFLYLTELLRMGKGEEVEKAIEELFLDESDDLNEDKLLVVPKGSKIDLESIKVPDKAVIGSGCRLMGNIRAASLRMNNNNTLFGSIRTVGGIVVGEGNLIHGDLITKGDVRVYKDTHILGEINGKKIFVHEKAKVDGAMRAPDGVIITKAVMETETTVGSILDLVPESMLKKDETITRQQSTQNKALKTNSPAQSADPNKTPADIKAKTVKSLNPEINIPKKRLITAIRLSDMEKSVKTDNRSINKAVSEKKSTAKKTAPQKKSGTKQTEFRTKSITKKPAKK